ncbi:MAG TPA: hypothetical protein VLS48_04425 [Anaerolineales bacterium]|nr:hypothetical protein [Anaerolineales bacterium]
MNDSFKEKQYVAVEPIPKAPPEQKNGGMQALAEREYHHHRTPLPEAHQPPAPVFPRPVMMALAVSILVGVVIGWIFGVLLLNNSIVIAGWEGLYSMSPFTFKAFWAFIGAALGIALGGVGGLLFSAAPPKISS